MSLLLWQKCLLISIFDENVYSNGLQLSVISFHGSFHGRSIGRNHRRRIKTEEKEKVFAAVWEQNLFNSLPRYLFCTRKFKKKDKAGFIGTAGFIGKNL